MNLETAQRQTAYYLAHPENYDPIAYRIIITPLDHTELGILDSDVQMIKEHELYNKRVEILDNVELAREVEFYTGLGGYSCLGGSLAFKSAGYFATREAAKKICQVAAKTLGIGGLGGIAVAMLIGHLVSMKTDMDELNYTLMAANVATCMHQNIHIHQSAIQMAAMRAHMLITGEQQAQINAQRNEIVALRAQMSRVLSLLESPNEEVE